MTLAEIKSSTATWLTAQDIASVMECDANEIRRQAQDDPSKLGFPVTVICRRVKVNRKGFLRFLGEDEKEPPHLWQ